MFEQLQIRRDNIRITIREKAKGQFLKQHRQNLLSESSSTKDTLFPDCTQLTNMQAILSSSNCQSALDQLAHHIVELDRQPTNKSQMAQRQQIVAVLKILMARYPDSQQLMTDFIIQNLIKPYFDAQSHDLLFPMVTNLNAYGNQLKLLQSIQQQLNITNTVGIEQIFMIETGLQSEKLSQDNDQFKEFLLDYYTNKQQIERIIESLQAIENPEHSLELLYLINDLLEPSTMQAMMECGLHKKLLVYIQHGYQAEKEITYRILHNLCLVKEYRNVIEKEQFLKRILQRFPWQRQQVQQYIVYFMSSYFQILEEPHDLTELQQWCSGQNIVVLMDWVSLATEPQVINSFKLGIRNLYVLGSQQHQDLYEKCGCGSNRFTRIMERTGRLPDLEEMCLS